MIAGHRVVGSVVVGMVGLGLCSGCFAEDGVIEVCHERARSPAILTGTDAPTSVTLELACDAELALGDWNIHADPNSFGAPSSSAVLTADRARGRAFVLTGTFTPQSFVNLRAIEISATRDDGVRDRIIVVDWSVAP